jgi:hypothetical protein
MISKLHLFDIISGILVAAPLSFVMIAAAGWLAWRARARWDAADGWMALVTGAAASGGLFLVMVWHFDFAIWGDWNIATAYLFPLNLLGWVALMPALRLTNRTRGLYIGLLAPMLAVQAFLAFGILMQLY